MPGIEVKGPRVLENIPGRLRQVGVGAKAPCKIENLPGRLRQVWGRGQ